MHGRCGADSGPGASGSVPPPDALAAKRTSCSASRPTPILSAVLPIASAAEMERSTRAARPPTVVTPISAPPSVRMPVRSSSAWRPRPFSPPEARSPALSIRVRALLAALVDRDQLGLDLAAALDRQPDGVGVRASGHRSLNLRLQCLNQPSLGREQLGDGSHTGEDAQPRGNDDIENGSDRRRGSDPRC